MTGIGSVPEITESGAGHPVVLVHPLGADRRYWEGLRERLPDRRLIAYDLPGHGGRPPVGGEYEIADLAEDLIELLDRLGLSAASIVGVSIGGLVAQSVASRYPERTTSIIIVDSVAVYPSDFAANLAARAELVLAEGLDAVVEATLAMWFTAELLASPEPEDRALVALVKSMLHAASPEGYAQACNALVAADLTTAAGDIVAPTAVVCGSDDLPAFSEGAEWLHAAIPRATLTWLEGGRHAAALECADDFAAVLNGALPR